MFKILNSFGGTWTFGRPVQVTFGIVGLEDPDELPVHGVVKVPVSRNKDDLP